MDLTTALLAAGLVRVVAQDGSVWWTRPQHVFFEGEGVNGFALIVGVERPLK